MRLTLITAMLLACVLLQANAFYDGNWMVYARTDPLTDQTETTVGKFEENPTGRRGAIMFRKSGKELDVFIAVGQYVIDSEAYMRFDGGDIHSFTWQLSADNTALFATDPLSVLHFMLEADGVVVSVFPYKQRRRNMIFDLTGLDDVLLRHFNKH